MSDTKKATGWRTAVVDKAESITLLDGCISIQGKGTQELPLSQFGTLLIAENRCTLSAPLLYELANQGIKLILCNKKWEPAAEFVPLGVTTECAGRIMDQANWSEANRDRVWAQIVKAKIKNQSNLLQELEIHVPEGMTDAMEAVAPGDSDNREGMAARLYFSALFGYGFVRHSADSINAALNYGYAILRSCFSRFISAHGYHTALGIHHRNRTNPFNLSCDIMEPFRPFVDMVAWRHGEKELDWSYKQELIAITTLPILYGNRRMCLQDAAEQYVLNVLRTVDHPERTLKEIGFV